LVILDSLTKGTRDFEAAAEAVRQTDFLGRGDLAEGIVRPPTAEEAITVFEKMAGRSFRG
jgi:hypothetical protein